MTAVDDLDPLALVDARRADGLDPVRFAVAEALARRAAAQQGEARAAMVRRVEALLAEAPRAVVPARLAPPEALSRLSALVDRLGRTSARPGAAPAAGLSRTAPPRPLKSVARFNGTWSRLRVEQRLRQALAQVPAQAGPLNSSHLVNRTLQALQDLSPEYLDAFMSHVDTLQWLEQASGAGDLAAAASPPAEARRRAPSRTPRKA